MDAVDLAVAFLRACWRGLGVLWRLLGALDVLLVPFEALYYREQCEACEEAYRTAPRKCENCGHRGFEPYARWWF